MIILDTHIWVWWVHGDARLPDHYRTYVEMHETQGLGVSVISCWEVAKLVEYGRLTLPCPMAEWLDQALAYPGIRLLELTSRISDLPTAVFVRAAARRSLDLTWRCTGRLCRCAL